MRLALGLSTLIFFAFAAIGCGSGGGEAAPEDAAFQKSLADAAAKNKGKGPVEKNTMKKPPADPTAKPGVPPGSAPASGGNN